MTPVLLDTIVLIVIVLSVVIAFFRGFIKEVLTIVNLMLSAAAAYLLAPMLLPTAKGWFGVPVDKAVDKAIEHGDKIKKFFGVIPADVMATFVSYLIVYFSVFIILSLAGMAISSGAKAMGLGPLDRFLGMVFGAVRGFLLVFVIYVPFAIFVQPEKMPAWAKDSVTVTVLDAAYQKVDAYMKGEHPVSADKDGEDHNIDPHSLKGKLLKMSDQFLNKAQEAHENVSNDVNKSEDSKDMLTDDEKNKP